MPDRLMSIAADEARKSGHEYVATEHILLALLVDESSIGTRVFRALGVPPDRVRQEVDKVVPAGFGKSRAKQLPFTPRAKKCIDRAAEEAKKLGFASVSSAHVLLGLVSEPEGVAAHVVLNLGLKLEDVRRTTLDQLIRRDKGRDTKIDDRGSCPRRARKPGAKRPAPRKRAR